MKILRLCLGGWWYLCVHFIQILLRTCYSSTTQCRLRFHLHCSIVRMVACHRHGDLELS